VGTSRQGLRVGYEPGDAIRAHESRQLRVSRIGEVQPRAVEHLSSDRSSEVS
jgi:hypothetical protein